MPIIKLAPRPYRLSYIGLLALTFTLNGCAHKALHAQVPEKAAGNIVTKAPDASLTAEFVYRYLIAEIAGQRGDYATSGTVFYNLAKSDLSSPYSAMLAKRAAEIGAYGNMPSLAIPAIKLWAELDPKSTEAQKASTEMWIATGNLKEAEPHLAQLLRQESTRAGGFLSLNNLLSRSKDKIATLRLVQSLAKPYPELAEAHFAMAQAATIANQDDLALKEINLTEQLNASWPLVALFKGQLLEKQSPQAAIDFYRHFLDTNPEEIEVRIQLARSLVNQKQFTEAKQLFPAILEQAKNNAVNTQFKNHAEVTAIVGLLAYQSADYPSAEGYFKQALSLGMKSKDQLYIYLGQTAEKLDQTETAIAWYQKITPTDAHYLDAQINLANLIALTQSTDKAVDFLDVVEDLNTEQQIIVIQAQASLLGKAQRHKEAFDLLEKAIKNLPNSPDLIYDYALAAERTQKFELMESELRRAMAIKPDFAAAYNALGYSFADRNIRLNEAITLIEKALKIAPNDYFMLDSLGWAHYRKGNLNQALRYLQQAYSTSQDPEIAAHLGEVLWKKGQYEQAKKIWDDALISHPHNETLINTANKFKS